MACESYLRGNGPSRHAVDQGVYEVFWANSKKIKQIYASKHFSQTDYVTDKGGFRTGDMAWVSGPERVVGGKVAASMPGEITLSRTLQEFDQETIDGQDYRCVTLSSKVALVTSAKTIIYPAYCLDKDRLALRYQRGTGMLTSEYSGQTKFDEISVFHGHFIAKDIQVNQFDKPYLHIHLDVIEDLTEINDSSFEPPRDAAPIGQPRPVVSDMEMQSRLVENKEAESVPVFNDRGVDERVVLSLIVGKDGRVISVRPIGGWKNLQKVMSKAAAQWVYKPYLIAGQPVEVETEIVRDFSMKNNKK